MIPHFFRRAYKTFEGPLLKTFESNASLMDTFCNITSKSKSLLKEPLSGSDELLNGPKSFISDWNITKPTARETRSPKYEGTKFKEGSQFDININDNGAESVIHSRKFIPGQVN